jgi:beta-phosphoglucomutase-like phosphatase (HAD superfamily)
MPLQRKIRAIIFDFNGVIADDETTHFLTFQQALQEDGLALTKEDYYGAWAWTNVTAPPPLWNQ